MIRFDSEAISDTTKSKMSFNCINTRSLIAENHSKKKNIVEVQLTFVGWFD